VNGSEIIYSLLSSISSSEDLPSASFYLRITYRRFNRLRRDILRNKATRVYIRHEHDNVSGEETRLELNSDNFFFLFDYRPIDKILSTSNNASRCSMDIASLFLPRNSIRHFQFAIIDVDLQRSSRETNNR